MKKNNPEAKPGTPRLRCAIYTRKSTEEGLDQDFSSLDAQREASEAFIHSQKREGWIALPDRYDDGGFTGANTDRPALKRLLAAVEVGKLDCVVVYKVDRLSRSLLDFTRMLSIFEKHNVSFVAVTQQFNTSTSLGRLTLNILLSFAQFERELIGERTRDKMSAARKKGKWVGGCPVLGYDLDPSGGRLRVNEEEAERVRAIFDLFEKRGSIVLTLAELQRRGWTLKSWKGGRVNFGRARLSRCCRCGGC
jgi:site-specific DNA recombinase